MYEYELDLVVTEIWAERVWAQLVIVSNRN